MLAIKAIDIINLGPITITSDALFTFFNLIVLFLFFRFFLFKPVNKILDERQKLIEDEIAEAMEKKKEAEQLKTEYQEALDNAEETSVQIIKDAKERAQIAYNKKVEESHAEAGRIMEEANRAIELEKKKSMEQAQSEIAGIALLAAQKVIQKNVDEEDNKKLVSDFLQEAGASK